MDFSMFYEYLDDADLERAHEAELKWQERQYRRIMRKLITRAGITRLFSWL